MPPPPPPSSRRGVKRAPSSLALGLGHASSGAASSLGAPGGAGGALPWSVALALERAVFGDALGDGDGDVGEGPQAAAEEAATQAAAWHDPDDAALMVELAQGPARRRKLRKEEEEEEVDGDEYQRRIREHFAKATKRTKVPSWARVDAGDAGAKPTDGGATAPAGDADESSLAALLQSGRALLQRETAASGVQSAGPIPRGTLAVSRLIDANIDDVAQCPADVVAFHPKADVPLLLVAGLDKVARVFRCSYAQGGEGCLARLGITETPIRCAAWDPSGRHVVAAGRRPRVHIWDVAAGTCANITPPRIDVGQSAHAPSCESFAVNDNEAAPLVALPRSHGAVQLLSLRGHQSAGVLRTGAGTVRALCFGGGSRSNELLTASRDGTVSVWDVRMMRSVASSNVGQGTGVIGLATSTDGSRFAASLTGGYVHVYDWLGDPRASSEPLHRFGNLTTAVDGMTFSPDSSLLCFRSRLARDALRVAHLGSGTVYSNWPSAKTPLQFVHAASFSAQGGCLAVGNARGRVLLYRLGHYGRL